MKIRPHSGTVLSIAATREHAGMDEDVIRLVADHQQLGDLCDLLETCADELPCIPSQKLVERICSTLEELYATNTVGPPPYPALSELYDATNSLETVLLKQIQLRHLADTMHAQDLVDALRGLLVPHEPRSPDALGYMLRCFFDGCRKAMDCEELAILALSRHQLSAKARSTLINSLRERTQPSRRR
ncbi:hypothetical protein HD841_000802 [Sphingomonas melonis]|uniref:Hemerythrin-like domain-containing protein n=2 Tax=Sphingomonas melonis TaxID=152682 RepID=A0A7Y9FKK6_9SPHN|nr:hypothetical protein [Sphingomonas melonis]